MKRRFDTAVTVALSLALFCVSGCDITPEEPNLAGNKPRPAGSAEETPGEPLLAAAQQPGKPNILLIVADDLGYFDLGAYGGEIKTPNIDALAKSGVRFGSMRAAPVCAPSRAMLMTGIDSHSAGVGDQFPRGPQIGAPGYEAHLKPEVPTVAEVLQKAGYKTYMAGKWHLGEEATQSPRARGFDRSFAMLLGGGSHFDKTGPAPDEAKIGPFREDGGLIDALPDNFYSTRFYTDRLIDNISSTPDGQPFFAYAAYTSPHWPLQVPDDYLDRYKGVYDAGYEVICKARAKRAEAIGLLWPGSVPAQCTTVTPKWDDLSPQEQAYDARLMELYAAMVENLDANIGRLVAHLKDSGRLDNTFIFFMSDNGADGGRRERMPDMVEWIAESFDNSPENLGRKGSFVSYGPGWASVGMSPYRDHKGRLTDGGIRVPAFATYPGVKDKGSWSDKRLTVRDVAHTFAELAGTQMPSPPKTSKAQTRGQSFLPQLLDGAEPNRPYDSIYAWEFSGSKTIIKGNWKLLETMAPRQEPTGWMLFNLRSDPFERTNVAASEPEVLAEMVALYQEYAETFGVVELP